MANSFGNEQWRTTLFRAFSSHQQSQHIQTNSISQPPQGQTEQTLMACTAAEALQRWKLRFPVLCMIGWSCLGCKVGG